MGRRGVVLFVPRLGEERRPKGEPLSKLWAEYLPTLETASASKRNQAARVRALTEVLGEFPTPREIAAWLSSLRMAGLGPNTVRLYRDTFARVYSYSNDTGAAAGNPVKLCPWRAPKPVRQGIKGIERVWPFLSAVALDARERAFWGVMRFAGLRPGEALALGLEDVLTSRLLDGWQLSVTKTRDGNKSEHRAMPKTRASFRRVPVSSELVELLKPVLAFGAVTWRRGRGGGRLETCPYLFPYRYEPSIADQLRRLRGVCPDGFDADKEEALHVFRHSCAIDMVQRHGARPEQLQGFLGHSSIKECDAYLRGLIGAQRAGQEIFKGPLAPNPKGGRGTGPPKNSGAGRRANAHQPPSTKFES